MRGGCAVRVPRFGSTYEGLKQQELSRWRSLRVRFGSTYEGLKHEFEFVTERDIAFWQYL